MQCPVNMTNTDGCNPMLGRIIMSKVGENCVLSVTTSAERRFMTAGQLKIGSREQMARRRRRGQRNGTERRGLMRHSTEFSTGAGLFNIYKKKKTKKLTRTKKL